MQEQHPELAITLRFEESGNAILGGVDANGDVEDREYPPPPEDEANDDAWNAYNKQVSDYLNES